ncbi:hypothetical protein [Candidatus Paracaedibacter symbiosus]|uniref:hypothetical protein n=1 Tax=Candidatus Paracaedibacter symbiosus TaxID=244582 RepID=UPI0018DC7600|nr:hypothetical protein [Candidatus Paracaedibacter symbiosus]
MKYQFMQEHQHDFKIERMSQVLNVARSGYYRFIKAQPSKLMTLPLRRIKTGKLIIN